MKRSLTMKKIICALLVLVTLLTVFAACGEETFTCHLCGKEKTSKKHTKEVLGQEVHYCDDCYESLNELGDLIKG